MSATHSSAPPHGALRQALQGMFVLRPLQRRRWPFALRASACMGTPVLVGWLSGDVSAGLMATIGGFTSLYGSGRPYTVRARLLALVAVSFALAVGLGILVSPWPWLAVLTVAVIAMLSTWLCNALQTGPPGAYMFMLACASGTAMPADHLAPGHATALVLAGGTFAWMVHMAGALFRPRGPEQDAVTAAGRAVIGYLEAIGQPRERKARHAAALALHGAWTDLVQFQPTHVLVGQRLRRLRIVNRGLHLLFADAMGAAARNQPPAPEARGQAAELMAQIAHLPRKRPPPEADAVPLGRPRAPAMLADALRPGTLSRRVIVRVGVAALAAGIVGIALGLERAYWAIAAAVLMLHQGFDWVRMLQRSFERVLGTFAGLLLAGAVLAWHPQGWWLVAVIVAIQFSVEMLVVRNYALAVVFITGAALTIASGGLPIDDLGGFLAARGIDTAAGCALALVVFWLLPPRPAAQIRDELARTLVATAALVPVLARGEAISPRARQLRQELQAQSFALEHAHEAATLAWGAQRQAAERDWTLIAATQRLVYRTLSTAWAIERRGDGGPGAAAEMFDGRADTAAAALSTFARIARDATPRGLPVDLPQLLPPVIGREMLHLQEAFARVSAQPAEASAAGDPR